MLKRFVFVSNLFVVLVGGASPTGQPTQQPTHQPTHEPTRQPSSQPSRQPTGQPSRYVLLITIIITYLTNQLTYRAFSTNLLFVPSWFFTFLFIFFFSRCISIPFWYCRQPICHPSGQPTRQPSQQPTGSYQLTPISLLSFLRFFL